MYNYPRTEETMNDFAAKQAQLEQEIKDKKEALKAEKKAAVQKIDERIAMCRNEKANLDSEIKDLKSQRKAIVGRAPRKKKETGSDGVV